MERRTFIAVTGMFFTVLFSIGAAGGQGSPHRLARNRLTNNPWNVSRGLRKGLQTRGYQKGRDIHIEYRWAEGNVDRLPDLAAELVRLKVDVIVAGGSVGAMAAKNATRTIPIVIAGVGDPVEQGLVSNLARPGGNITGFGAAPSETSKRNSSKSCERSRHESSTSLCSWARSVPASNIHGMPSLS